MVLDKIPWFFLLIVTPTGGTVFMLLTDKYISPKIENENSKDIVKRIAFVVGGFLIMTVYSIILSSYI